MHEGDMLDARTDHWSREAHLRKESFDSVRQLNHRFLDLLVTPAGRGATGSAALSHRLSELIAPLTEAQKKAAADCPYALFDLRFHDDAHWQSRLLGGVAWQVHEAGPVDEEVVGFVRMALFLAWYVAHSGRVAAPLLLGMGENTVAAFRAVSIDQLASLAAMEAEHLTARWSHCALYWRALTGAAGRQSLDELRRIQLYGLQLTAAARLTP